MVRGLGADVVVDYKKDELEARLSGYDLVLHSQDEKTLEKSLRVLRAGGRLVSISGSGEQLRELAALVDAGAIRPVVDEVMPFASTNEALAYVDTGRAKGKVVIKVRS